MMNKIFAPIILLILLNACNIFDKHSINILQDSTLHYEKGFEPVNLIFYNGMFHLFYKNIDSANSIANENLRHAISRNLIVWEESSELELSDIQGPVYGGFVVDNENLTNLGNGDHYPVIAIMVQTTNIKGAMSTVPFMAYSNDNCITWKNTSRQMNLPETLLKNPQNLNIFRDKKSQKWIMSLARENIIEFYSSFDLYNWIFESSFGSDFFPEELNWERTTLLQMGDEISWILMADVKSKHTNADNSGTLYLVGNFDGHRFECESSDLRWVDFGRNIYSSTVMIADDDRRISIMVSVTEKQTGVMLVPGQLYIDSIGNEEVLSILPISEINEYHNDTIRLHDLAVSEKRNYFPIYEDLKMPVSLNLTFETSEIKRWDFPSRFGLMIKSDGVENIYAGYDVPFSTYFIENSVPETGRIEPRIQLKHIDSLMKVKILITPVFMRVSVANDKCIMTYPFDTYRKKADIFLYAENGRMNLIDCEIIKLNKELQ